MHIYLKNNHAKCHPNLILNDGVIGFFKRLPPIKKDEYPYGSVPDPKMLYLSVTIKEVYILTQKTGPISSLIINLLDCNKSRCSAVRFLKFMYNYKNQIQNPKFLCH